MLKYLKSFIEETPDLENCWTSILILFSDEGELKIDKGIIIKGNISPNNYGFYCNFNNFFIMNEELYYKYSDSIKKINPEHVYLHVRTGMSSFPLPENITYWYIFFPTLKNKVYLKIKDSLKAEKIKVYSSSENLKVRTHAYKLRHPFFFTYDAYDTDAILFSKFDISSIF